MEFSLEHLQPKERASFALRSLYETAGCRKYHMGRFEEYSLYQENRSFLSSEQVITFTDLDGRLLALKPDVTLSIAKTAQPAPGETLRYYYHENVYRPSAESHTFKEISQMGLELLGAVGEAEVQQAVCLAAQSLAALGAEWVLEVSHMGYLFGLFDALGVPEAARAQLLEKLRQKNAHELRAAALSAGLSETAEEDRAKLLQDTEGTSDKYVRTICSWLKQMGWVEQAAKTAAEDAGTRRYEGTIPQSYRLTLKGRTVFKHTTGVSKFARIPKRVMWDMLATKAADRDYLRNRRTHIIQYLLKDYRSPEQVKAYLEMVGLEETVETIKDDICGFENIGLNVKRTGKTYKIMDDIVGLEIPADDAGRISVKSDMAVVKDSVRERLAHVSHEYLILIDLGFDDTSDRDYEIQTAELFTRELDFLGGRLGDTRKPDVCIYYGKDGMIIDNKAYGKGYSLPIKQADEMYRYLEENKERNEKINPNRWWKVFDEGVTDYRFAFVSGSFTGGFKDRLENIHMRSGLCGGAIDSVTLLLLAEELKAGRMEYSEFFRLFDCNDEVTFQSIVI